MTNAELFARIPGLYSPTRNPRVEGWCTVDKAYDLAAAVLTIRPEVCVEIGVFGGSSLLPIAMALNAVGRGQVIGVDPWDPAESAKGQEGADLAWWTSLDHEKIYQGFMRAVVAEGVSNQVVVLRQTSEATPVPKVIDLLHLDGNHGPQAFKDVKRFGAKVRVGGMAFLDDIGWKGGAVGKAAEWLLGQGFVKLYDRDTGAMFQRVE